MRNLLLLTILIRLVLATPVIAVAQIHSDGTAQPLSEDLGPLSDDSLSVHDTPSTLREGSVGSMRSGSVRDSSVGSMRSGPISDLSAGPMSGSNGIRADAAVTDGSVGAVKFERDRPLGERISEPLRELGALQEELRAIQPLPAVGEPNRIEDGSDEVERDVDGALEVPAPNDAAFEEPMLDGDAEAEPGAEAEPVTTEQSVSQELSP